MKRGVSTARVEGRASSSARVKAEAIVGAHRGRPLRLSRRASRAHRLVRTLKRPRLRHDYLKSLSVLLAEHGRKAGADMKKLLDPNSAAHCKSKQVIISDSDDE